MWLLCRRRGAEDSLLLETDNTEGFGAAVDGELQIGVCVCRYTCEYVCV